MKIDPYYCKCPSLRDVCHLHENVRRGYFYLYTARIAFSCKNFFLVFCFSYCCIFSICLQPVDVKIVFVLDRYCLCLLPMARTKSMARKPGKGPGVAAKVSANPKKGGFPPKGRFKHGRKGKPMSLL